jgi:drug/metabolite transporter (DMT)-like permease
VRSILYTALALVAFASNSILCRIALRQDTIDPATFSTIRLAAGAATLLLITLVTGRPAHMHVSWLSAGLLFLYAVPFSFAYVGLSTATGALILFGCVQVTMMIAAIWSGERPHVLQWSGIGAAIAGLVYLMLPGLAAPAPASAALMALAGFAWGIYSLRGRGAQDPLAQTTSNFVRAVPMVAAVSVLAFPRLHVQPTGVLLAVASGALASALGYVVWYAALRTLTATRAAAVQLSVPVLAAAGGVVFLAEAVSLRLVLSAVMVLGGISLALGSKQSLWSQSE